MIKTKNTKPDIKLVNILSLKPHECASDFNRLIKIKKSILAKGLHFPIVVDKKTKIILDGHYRFKIFQDLRQKNIPVYYVDYSDQRIILVSLKEK
ncbi:ParB N-terminal domain-containing protein, partial [Patescibacteria group bacterium]|nr:ParB N-terminal domain-containing protein [Patescibacteria group bacterium]